MKSDKFPIGLDGRRYLVDRTFGGEAAAYRVSKSRPPRWPCHHDRVTAEHVAGESVGPSPAVLMVESLEEGQVIIIGREAPPRPADYAPGDALFADQLYAGSPLQAVTGQAALDLRADGILLRSMPCMSKVVGILESRLAPEELAYLRLAMHEILLTGRLTAGGGGTRKMGRETRPAESADERFDRLHRPDGEYLLQGVGPPAPGGGSEIYHGCAIKTYMSRVTGETVFILCGPRGERLRCFRTVGLSELPGMQPGSLREDYP